MNRQRLIAIGCVAFVALMVMTSVAAARGRKALALTAQGEKIEADYTKMLEDLRKEVVSLVPRVDEKVKADFIEQHSALRNIPAPTEKLKPPFTCQS